MLEVIDWIVAGLVGVYAAGTLLLGVVFGLFALGNPGAGAAVAWSLASGLATGLGAALCAAAALAMRHRWRGRWLLQLAAFPVLAFLWSLSLCLAADVSVSFGPWKLCSR